MSRLVFAVVSLVALVAVAAPSVVHADGLALSNIYMTGIQQPSGQPVTDYPTSTQAVYVDFTVLTASTTDTAEVHVFGPNHATTFGNLLVVTTGDKVGHAAWSGNSMPNGGWCAYFVINGVQDNFGGQLPLAFTIGGGAQPTCPATMPVPTVAHVSRVTVHRHGAGLTFRWHVANTARIAGFNVYAHGERLNRAVIPVRGRDYRVVERWAQGPYAVRAIRG